MDRGSSRTAVVKRNIVASFFIKGISIFASLLIVPITIDFLDASLYGIWLTLSSIIIWLGYFDLGFTHGFRNSFAKAVAEERFYLARSLVSTTYACLIVIFSFLFIAFFLIKDYINWSHALNLNESYNSDVSKAFLITVFFFCIQMILKVMPTLLLADQKTALAGSINAIGQILNLIIILIISRNIDGTLSILSIILGASSVFVLIVFTMYFFLTKYWEYRPSIFSIDFRLLGDIVGLGGKFFLIQVSWLFIYQSINVIISRINGPDDVTSYNIQYKLFNLMYMVVTIFLSPMWSAFTEAYAKKDFVWMRKTYNNLNKAWLYMAVLMLFLLFVSPYIFYFWIGDKISLHFVDSFFMFLYVILISKASIYISLISGIGKIAIQSLVNLGLAIISIPLFVGALEVFGLSGLIFTTCFIPLIQILFFHIQLKRLLNGQALGIWNK